jgi:hypothetical protein
MLRFSVAGRAYERVRPVQPRERERRLDVVLETRLVALGVNNANISPVEI